MLGVGDLGAAGGAQGGDAGVHTGDAFVENEGVGDDGAGHAAGLGDVVHPEDLGDMLGDGGAELGGFVEDLGGGVDALFEGGGGGVDRALGDG